MLRTMMNKNGHAFHKFERNERPDFFNEMLTTSNKTQHSLDVADLIINENKAELDLVLNKLITQKLGLFNSCFTTSCGQEYPAAGPACTSTDLGYGRTCNTIDKVWNPGAQAATSLWCQEHPVYM